MFTDSYDTGTDKENVPPNNVIQQANTSETAEPLSTSKFIEHDDEYNMHYLAHKKVTIVAACVCICFTNCFCLEKSILMLNYRMMN
jgi:hypothetical protein